MARIIKDFLWNSGMTVEKMVEDFGSVGYQSIELHNASKVILKMKQSGSKVFLTFTSNMITSGLRGFFAQIVRLGMVDVIVTTSASIEEDIMKSLGEGFEVNSFSADDIALHERGENRIGNIVVRNESYMKFEDKIRIYLNKIYEKTLNINGQKKIYVSDLIKELGKLVFEDTKDENSFIYQTYKNNVPVFCPGIADSSIGFHLHLFCQEHPDFFVDVIGDCKNIIFASNYDEKKGLISLGGSISKHYAIFSGLLNGGFDYVVYLTTAHQSSGSVSGATTKEAMSWGKIKDNASAVTVYGDVTINFPLVMIPVLERLERDGMLENKK